MVLTKMWIKKFWSALAIVLLMATSSLAPATAVCDPSQQACSGSYGVSETFWGSGGELNACSTSYCTKQAAGETAVGNTASSYPSNVLTDSPLMYWRLGDTSGTTAVDSTTNGRNGAYQNSPTLGVTGLVGTDSNRAVQFDGVNDYASIASAAWMNVAAFTVEAWIKTTDTGDSIVSRDNAINDKAWRLWVSSGKASLIVHNGGSNYTLNGATTVNDGNVHHVVGTYASGTLKVYVDGVLDGTLSSAAHSVSGTPAIRVGTDRLVAYNNAVIDEAAFYGSELTATQVAKHYAIGGLTGGSRLQAGFNTDRTEYLEFQVNTASIDFGTLATGSTATGTATFSVKSYLANGYQVVTASTPPKNSSYTMAGMASPAASAAGTEQFGINLRANTSPTTFGANPVQQPDDTFSFGAPATGYNTVNQYKYVNGDVIASSSRSSGQTDFTISYILNIGSLTRGGTYTMSHVLVATSTF